MADVAQEQFESHRVLFREWLEIISSNGRASFQELNNLCQESLMRLSDAESGARFYRKHLQDAEKLLMLAMDKLHMDASDLLSEQETDDE